MQDLSDEDKECCGGHLTDPRPLQNLLKHAEALSQKQTSGATLQVLAAAIVLRQAAIGLSHFGVRRKTRLQFTVSFNCFVSH